jgi:biotin transport system permease protein
MSLGLYFHEESPIHRLSPGAKLGALAVLGTGLFFISDWRLLAGALAGAALLCALARIPWRVALDQLRPALWVIGLLFAVQALVEGWAAGLALALRFAALILLASLVTLTTRVSDMTDSIETWLAPFSRLGVNPVATSLALSLAIRFIPVISGIAAEVRDAQRARGLERSFVAVAVPVIVRTLKMADDIADAMDARSYDPRRGPAGIRAGSAAEASLRTE